MRQRSFEITLPPGYEVDDLPPPVADFEFASYHSKTEVKGNVIGYTRTFEVKELRVPVSKSEELKKFYRTIASDERNTAVLKPKQEGTGPVLLNERRPGHILESWDSI